MTTPSRGWYPDPHVPQQMRWWDGGSWTDDTYQRIEPMADWTASTPAGAGSTQVQARPVRGGPAGAAAASTEDGVPLADWWSRAGAWLVDAVLTALITGVVAFQPLLTAGNGMLEQAREAVRASEAGERATYAYDPATLRALVILSVAWLAVTLVYDLVFLLARGATPGKMVLGLRVRRWTPGTPLTASTVALRWLTSDLLSSISYVGTLYGVLDVLRPLRDPRRQSLHDKFAGTCVVRPPRPDATSSSL